MDWEIINVVTGLVSAVCAVIGVGYFNARRSSEESKFSDSVKIAQKTVAFVIVCSGWVLMCLSYLWVLEPYGSFPNDSDYRQFFGVIIALPAIMIFMFGLEILSDREASQNETSKDTGES